MIKAYKQYKVNRTNTDNIKYVGYNIVEVQSKTQNYYDIQVTTKYENHDMIQQN
jgi:hypothetical protein